MTDQEIMEQIKYLMDNAEEAIDDMDVAALITQLLDHTQNRDDVLYQLAEDGYELGGTAE